MDNVFVSSDTNQIVLVLGQTRRRLTQGSSLLGCETTHLISKENISSEMRPEILTESLILAQDERWRRA